jgi:hypothetical protein
MISRRMERKARFRPRRLFRDKFMWQLTEGGDGPDMWPFTGFCGLGASPKWW